MSFWRGTNWEIIRYNLVALAQTPVDHQRGCDNFRGNPALSESSVWLYSYAFIWGRHNSVAFCSPAKSLTFSVLMDNSLGLAKSSNNHFPLLIKVSLIINICSGSPKSGNTTFRIANTKPILKYIFSCPYSNPAPLGGPRGHVSFNYYGCTTKLRLSGQSSGSTFPLLRLYYKVATFEPELREHVSFTTAVLQSCDFRARAPGARFLYYGCTTKLRLSSLSSGSTFPLHGCTTKLRLSSQSSGNTFTQNPQPKTTKRDLNSRYLNSLFRNVRLKRFYGTEQGDHSCKQAYTEQEVPPKPALQNQGTPNNKNCFAGRVFFLIRERGGGGGVVYY